MTYLIERFSRRLAGEVQFTGDARQDADVITYAIKVLLLNAGALAGIIIISWLLGTLRITLTIWAAAFSLRVFAGGRHSSGPVVCWLLTVGVFTALGFIVHTFAPSVDAYVLLFTSLGLGFALYTVITSAPVTISSKQFTPEKRHKLKMAAVAVVVFWAVVALASLQSVTEQPLTPLGITLGVVVQSFFIISYKSHKTLS